MARRSNPSDPTVLRQELIALLQNFETQLENPELRVKVIGLVPSFHKLRDLGCSLMPEIDSSSGRERILAYFKKYLGQIINGDEFMVVSGIHDYPRRVRELRKQDGWQIISGRTAKEMHQEGELPVEGVDVSSMKPDDYILASDYQDKEAAFRWQFANGIRKKKTSIQEKVIEFMRKNVGNQINGEELRYVANDKSEWARRVRELRTEQGWPILTKASGRPDLPVGVYVLESERQSPPHDRDISDPVRNVVLRRDNYHCIKCDWHHELWNRSDPRHLELHHKIHHADGGENTAENLITVCTICHDEIHRNERI